MYHFVTPPDRHLVIVDNEEALPYVFEELDSTVLASVS